MSSNIAPIPFQLSPANSTSNLSDNTVYESDRIEYRNDVSDSQNEMTEIPQTLMQYLKPGKLPLDSESTDSEIQSTYVVSTKIHLTVQNTIQRYTQNVNPSSNSFKESLSFKPIDWNPVSSFEDLQANVAKYNVYAYGLFAKENWFSFAKVQDEKYQDQFVFSWEGAKFQNKRYASWMSIVDVVPKDQSVLYQSDNQLIYKLDYPTFCEIARPYDENADPESYTYLLRSSEIKTV